MMPDRCPAHFGRLHRILVEQLEETMDRMGEEAASRASAEPALPCTFCSSNWRPATRFGVALQSDQVGAIGRCDRPHEEARGVEAR